jgi:Fic family protein
MRLSLIKSTWLDKYRQVQPISIQKHFNKLRSRQDQADAYGYALAQASVYSSMIEGNHIDLESYLRFSSTGLNTKSKSFREIEDLRAAYQFARQHMLSRSTFLSAHELSTQTILEEDKYRGSLRNKPVYIYSGQERIYTGADVLILAEVFEQFFRDVDILLDRELSMTECFYFAAFIHLVFVKIHPFADGNGRSARLLEKWFLASRLGEMAWFIESEKLYQRRIRSYYKHLSIGDRYENVDYSLAMPFLKMLPMALTAK